MFRPSYCHTAKMFPECLLELISKHVVGVSAEWHSLGSALDGGQQQCM